MKTKKVYVQIPSNNTINMEAQEDSENTLISKNGLRHWLTGYLPLQ